MVDACDYCGGYDHDARECPGCGLVVCSEHLAPDAHDCAATGGGGGRRRSGRRGPRNQGGGQTQQGRRDADGDRLQPTGAGTTFDGRFLRDALGKGERPIGGRSRSGLRLVIGFLLVALLGFVVTYVAL